MTLKRNLLATVSLLALLGAAHLQPAQAADLPVVKAPVKVADFNWTGFYIGLHGGAAWLGHRQTTFESNGACGAPGGTISECSLNTWGGVFGGFAGYNMQLGRFVYGLEVDGSWTGLKKSANYADIVGLSNSVITLTGQVDWLATVRGRLGIAMSPTLLYVTGGAAFGGVKSSWTDNDLPPSTRVTLSSDKTKLGWVLGAGIERAFGDRWTARAEVLYHDLGKVTAGPVRQGVDTYNTTFRHRVTTARAGLALRW